MEQLHKPDPKETLNHLEWMCWYNKWTLSLNTHPYTINGHITEMFESSIAISTGEIVPFRESYIADTYKESEETCIANTMYRIFNYALRHMTQAIKDSPIYTNNINQ